MTELFTGRWSVVERSEKTYSSEHSNMGGHLYVRLGSLQNRSKSRCPSGIDLNALPLDTPLKAGDHIEITARVVARDPLYEYPELKGA